MARRAEGKIIVEARHKGSVYALRFQVAGERHYIRLGGDWEGWDKRRAEAALRHTMADVERGQWKPARPEPIPDIDRDPSFHEFSSEWVAAREDGWQPKTRQDYEWRLSHHLLPFFKTFRLSQIGPAEVDRFRAAKLKQGTLAPGSINKTITLLAASLETALEYELVERNAAKGKSRRLKAPKPVPVWLDSAEHIAALLDAAGELDREARADHRVPRRAILATLTFAGLRIGELIELRWRDVDLAAAKITVRASKTDAGTNRTIDMLPVLRDELATHRANVKPESSSERAFPTRAGGRMNPSNVRVRILARAVTRANERLEAAGSVPLPDKLTHHKLRHTYASVLTALGTDPGAVMDQIGHASAVFTMKVYRHGMRRDERSREQLRALVEGGVVATDVEPAPETVR